MTLFVIFEGHTLAGKSYIANIIKEHFDKEGYVVSFFDEQHIIEECIHDDKLSIYDLYGLREQEYLRLLSVSDIILVEKSFITNLVYQLQNIPDYMIDDFVEFELSHYITDADCCQIYVLFRDYTKEEVDLFVGIAHYLLETYHIDITCLPNSQDDKTDSIVKHIIDKIELEVE